MTRLTFCASIIGLFAILNIGSVLSESNDDYRILDCLYETNSLACAKKQADAELDRIEVEVTGRQSSVTFSQALEDAGAFMVDGVRSILGGNNETEGEGDIEGSEDNSEEATDAERQARDGGNYGGNYGGKYGGKYGGGKKKYGKKMKGVMKMISLMMLMKAKMGLMLQMVSTHFQMKFFVIAVVSLIINVARFYIDSKGSRPPAKVIYYEHAQHQHHYEHDDDHGGYWGRSGEASPHDLPYSAHTSDHY